MVAPFSYGQMMAQRLGSGTPGLAAAPDILMQRSEPPIRLRRPAMPSVQPASQDSQQPQMPSFRPMPMAGTPYATGPGGVLQSGAIGGGYGLAPSGSAGGATGYGTGITGWSAAGETKPEWANLGKIFG